MRIPLTLAHQSTAPWRTARWGLADALAAGAVALVASSIVSVLALPFLLAGDLDDPAALTDTKTLTDAFMSSPPVLLASMLALWLGFVGGPFVVTRWRGNRSLAEDFGWSFTRRDVATGAGAGVALVLLSAAASAAASAAGLDLSDADNASFLADLPAVWVPAVALAVAVGAPLAEELYFRGLLLRGLMKMAVLRRAGARTTTAVAVLVSSALFGAAHLSAASVGGLFLAAVTGTFGVVLAVLAVTTGRLGAPVIAHMFVNTFGVAVVLITT